MDSSSFSLRLSISFSSSDRCINNGSNHSTHFSSNAAARFGFEMCIYTLFSYVDKIKEDQKRAPKLHEQRSSTHDDKIKTRPTCAPVCRNADCATRPAGPGRIRAVCRCSARGAC